MSSSRRAQTTPRRTSDLQQQCQKLQQRRNLKRKPKKKKQRKALFYGKQYSPQQCHKPLVGDAYYFSALVIKMYIIEKHQHYAVHWILFVTVSIESGYASGGTTCIGYLHPAIWLWVWTSQFTNNLHFQSKVFLHNWSLR